MIYDGDASIDLDCQRDCRRKWEAWATFSPSSAIVWRGFAETKPQNHWSQQNYASPRHFFFFDDTNRVISSRSTDPYTTVALTMSERTLVDIVVGDMCYLTLPCQHDVTLIYSDGSTEKACWFSWKIASELRKLGKPVDDHFAKGEADLAKVKASRQRTQVVGR